MAFDLCGHEGGKPSADVVPASNGGLFEREHDHGVAPPVAAPTTSVGIPDREGLETIGRGRVGAGGAFKEVLEHRGDQRLAKAARAAQVVVLPSPVGKLPDDVCLVNIKVSILPDFLKRLNAYGQSPVSCLCHSFLFLFANIRFFPQSPCFFLHSLSIIMLVLCPKRDISAEMCKG